MEQKVVEQAPKPAQMEATPEEVRAILDQYLNRELPDNQKPKAVK